MSYADQEEGKTSSREAMLSLSDYLKSFIDEQKWLNLAGDAMHSQAELVPALRRQTLPAAAAAASTQPQ